MKTILLIVTLQFSLTLFSQEKYVIPYTTNELSAITWKQVWESGVRCFEQNSKGQIFAGTWGVLRSDDNGESWDLISLPNIYYEANSIAVNSGDTLYLTTADDDKLYRSINNGTTWHELLKDSAHLEFTYVAVNSKDLVFVGTEYGLYRLANNDTELVPTEWKGRVERIAINKEDVLFLSSWSFHRSMDNGESWTKITSGLTNTGINAITFNSEGDVFVGGASPNGGVFKSSDDGDNWEKTLYTFQEESDSVVTAIYCNTNGDLLIGTFGIGIQLLNKDNQTVTSVGLNNLEWDAFITSFHLTPDGHILAGTSNGIYKSEQIFTATDHMADFTHDVKLEQNHPNPFQRQTNISYSLVQKSHVILTIINGSGRIIDKIVDSDQPRGYYSVTWKRKKSQTRNLFLSLKFR